MTPRMSRSEIELLESFLKCSNVYMEFGTGGSTFLACKFVKDAVIGIDSSKEWIIKVQSYCAEHSPRIKPRLLHVDIGELLDWGWPKDSSLRNQWPRYYEDVWNLYEKSYDADLYLIDGRFRVACFMKTLLNCRSDSIIMIHDFFSRNDYSIVRSVAREIAVVGELSAFCPSPGQNRSEIFNILEKFRYVPN